MRFGNGAVYSKTYLVSYIMLVNKELTICANTIWEWKRILQLYRQQVILHKAQHDTKYKLQLRAPNLNFKRFLT